MLQNIPNQHMLFCFNKVQLQPKSNMPEPVPEPNLSIQGFLMSTGRRFGVGLELKSAGQQLSRSKVGAHLHAPFVSVNWKRACCCPLTPEVKLG